MRNRITIGKWSVCLAAAAVAACSYGEPANETAANVDEVANGEMSTGADNAAGVNQAAPADDGNTAEPAGPGNGASAEPGAAPYHASGTEPFWSLTLGSQMVYDSADGPDVTVATPHSKSTRSGPMYVTPQMTVRINQFRRCTEASGEEVHDTVEVTIGTQKVSGCGEGDPPP